MKAAVNQTALNQTALDQAALNQAAMNRVALNDARESRRPANWLSIKGRFRLRRTVDGKILSQRRPGTNKTVATVEATDPRTFIESDDLLEQIAPVMIGKPARVTA